MDPTTTANRDALVVLAARLERREHQAAITLHEISAALLTARESLHQVRELRDTIRELKAAAAALAVAPAPSAAPLARSAPRRRAPPPKAAASMPNAAPPVSRPVGPAGGIDWKDPVVRQHAEEAARRVAFGQAS